MPDHRIIHPTILNNKDTKTLVITDYWDNTIQEYVDKGYTVTFQDKNVVVLKYPEK